MRSLLAALPFTCLAACAGQVDAPPPSWRDLFGGVHPLDTLVTGAWWSLGPNPIVRLDVARDSTLAFALYTVDGDVLHLSAQLYPLYPGESRTVYLALEGPGGFRHNATATVVDAG